MSPLPPSPSSETVEVNAEAASVQTSAISGSLSQKEAVGAGMNGRNFTQLARLSPEAEAKELGDYFEYNLKQKITIGKNQSAPGADPAIPHRCREGHYLE